MVKEWVYSVICLKPKLPSYTLIQNLRKDYHKKASNQSNILKINPTEAANKIWNLSDIRSKQHNPAYFIDIAFLLLCYPPELAYVVALQFSDYEEQIGFQPFGTIMVAIARVDSLYRGGMITRFSMMKDYSNLEGILSSKDIRIKKAGQMLTSAIIMSSESVVKAQQLYKNTGPDSTVKQIIYQELKKIDPRLASAIIS